MRDTDINDNEKNTDMTGTPEDENIFEEFEQQKKETGFEDKRSARAKRNREALKKEREDRKKSLIKFSAVVLIVGIILGAAIMFIGLSAAGMIDLGGEGSVIETSKVMEMFDTIGVNEEIAQSFFDDLIIYKNGDTGLFSSAEISNDIEHNSYDWQYLDTTSGRWSYDDGAGTVSSLGIDVSSHQGEIDWEAVAADGIDFAMIRVVYRGYGDEGSLNVDEQADANLSGATAAGLDVGAYVFSQAVNEEEAIDEAEAAIRVLENYDLTYPVVYDMEMVNGEDTRVDDLTQEQITANALAFCETMQDAGYKVMVYGNMSGMIDRLDLAELDDVDIWFAQYFSTPFFPYRMDMLQYTDTGSVSGIEGYVDMDICFTGYSAE